MSDFQLETDFFDHLGGLDRKKYTQQIRLIKALYLHGDQTVSKLRNRLNISLPNAMGVLNELIENKIINKKGLGKSIGGRKPDLYGLVDSSFFVVTVDMSIYKIRISIFDAEKKQLCEAEEYCIFLNNQKTTLNYIIKLINAYIDKSGINKNKILAIGVSMPGLVDSVAGINYTHLYFDDMSLSDIMEQEIKCPVFIENDAKAIALAEFRLGCARNKKDVLVLYLDWGIGLGMVLNGKIYRGVSGFAGEFSHISIVDNGMLCDCGKLGCLQTVASGKSMLEMAERGVYEGKSSIKLDTSDKYKYRELRKVISAALEGDQYAIKILDETGNIIGKGISTLMQLFNPEMIVLCGILAESGDLIVNPIKQGINTNTLKQIREKAKIKVTDFASDIGMYGALAVVMENVFEEYITPH